MKKLFFLLILFVSFCCGSVAKGKVRYKVGVDCGYDYFVGQFNDPTYVEQLGSYSDKGTVYSNYNPFLKSDGITSMSDWYVGITLEALFKKEHYGITTGIRYSQYLADYKSKNGNFFYWNVSTEGSDEIDYVRGNSIFQRNHYIGFPLDFRYLSGRNGHWVRFYFKVGTSWCFLLESDKKMNYTSGESEYLSDIGSEPDFFVGMIYPAFGFRICPRYPLVNIEFHLPEFYVNMPAAYFLPDVGAGVQLSVQFPLDADSYNSSRPMGEPYY